MILQAYSNSLKIANGLYMERNFCGNSTVEGIYVDREVYLVPPGLLHHTNPGGTVHVVFAGSCILGAALHGHQLVSSYVVSLSLCPLGHNALPLQQTSC